MAGFGGILAGAMGGLAQGGAVVAKGALDNQNRMDLEAQISASREEAAKRAEERASNRQVASEDRAQERKVAEETRVAERRKGLLAGVDSTIAGQAAQAQFQQDNPEVRSAEAAAGRPLAGATPAPNRAAMIRDAAIAGGDMDMARTFGDIDRQDYQRGRDTKTDERMDRTETRQDKQVEFSQKQSEAQINIAKRQMTLAESKNQQDRDQLLLQSSAAQKYVAATTDEAKQAALAEYVGANGKRKDLIDDADFTIKSLTNLANSLNLSDPEGAAEASGFALGLARRGAQQKGIKTPTETKTLNGVTYEKVAGGWKRVGQ